MTMVNPQGPDDARLIAAQEHFHLQFDRGGFHDQFDKMPFVIAHTLARHPLLQLARIIQLASVLPVESVEYNAGDLAVSQDPALTPRTGLSIDETLRQIEMCRSWMVLKNVEQDDDYRLLLNECLDQVQPVIDDVCPGMTARKAFIFVSSPGAVTPYHVDFEYNFLLQIRGRKTITVFDGQDRALFSELERERAVSGAPRNLSYREEFAPKGRAFELAPGTGVHVPLTSPHWVRVAGDVSVSFSITFQSRTSDMCIGAHRTNALLRKIGIQPRRVGVSGRVDACKFLAHRIVRKVESMKSKSVRERYTTTGMK